MQEIKEVLQFFTALLLLAVVLAALLEDLEDLEDLAVVVEVPWEVPLRGKDMPGGSLVQIV